MEAAKCGNCDELVRSTTLLQSRIKSIQLEEVARWKLDHLN